MEPREYPDPAQRYEDLHREMLEEERDFDVYLEEFEDYFEDEEFLGDD